MQEIINKAFRLIKGQHFDCLAVAAIDFNNKKINSFEISSKFNLSDVPFLYFDLASITKPLTLASVYQKDKKLFSSDMELLLNHRGGLPAWGRLSHDDWKNQIQAYEVKEKNVEYSDFSALRLMLELEKESGKSLKDLASFFWDPELCNWKDLPVGALSPVTGTRNGESVCGEVHDPNAFVLNCFCSHAGMFGTVEGLGRSLLNLDKETDFVKTMKSSFKGFNFDNRFLNGWDTVKDPSNSLAGVGAGVKTFGHLGFTGTSVWIDADKGQGHVILTNATRNYWYSRVGLTQIREEIGQLLWQYMSN